MTSTSANGVGPPLGVVFTRQHERCHRNQADALPMADRPWPSTNGRSWGKGSAVVEDATEIRALDQLHDEGGRSPSTARSCTRTRLGWTRLHSMDRSWRKRARTSGSATRSDRRTLTAIWSSEPMRIPRWTSPMSHGRGFPQLIATQRRHHLSSGHAPEDGGCHLNPPGTAGGSD